MLRTDRVIGLVWIGAEFVLSRFTSHFSWLLGGGSGLVRDGNSETDAFVCVSGVVMRSCSSNLHRS